MPSSATDGGKIFDRIRGWARDLVSFHQAQGVSGVDFWDAGPVRSLLWQLAHVDDEGSTLEVLGGSWEEVTMVDVQKWQLSRRHPWREVAVVRMYAVREDRWRHPSGASLPLFSTQVPPLKGTEERAEFDQCVIAGFNDDWNGIWRHCCVLQPERLREMRFDERVVEEAEKGMNAVFRKQPVPFIQGGEGVGQYERVRRMERELEAAMDRVENPAGGRAYEGPLSYHPFLTAPAVAVEKMKDGVNIWRLCWNHSASGLNDCLESQECVLPTCDQLVFFLRPNMFWVKMDGINGFGHFPLGITLSECFGFERIGTGGYYRRRVADFGSSVAPACAQRFADAFVNVLARQGIGAVMYSDDLGFQGGMTEEEANIRRDKVLAIGDEVGYHFARDSKLFVGKRGVFLGKEIDTTGTGLIRLPEEKVEKYRQDVEWWLREKQGTMKELARLTGRLNFACGVMIGGVGYLMNLYRDMWDRFQLDEGEEGLPRMQSGRWCRLSLLAHQHEGDTPRCVFKGVINNLWVWEQEERKVWEPERVISLSAESMADLRWWKKALVERNGLSLHLDDDIHRGTWRSQKEFGTDIYIDSRSATTGGVAVVTTDAARSGSVTSGAWWSGPVTHRVDFMGADKEEDINWMELAAAVRAVETIGEMVTSEQGGRILVRCDNMSAVHIINRGGSHSKKHNLLARRLCEFGWRKRLEVWARYIPTHLNFIGDDVSRKKREPDSHVLSLSAAGWAWMSSCLHFEKTEVIVFPGGAWESPLMVARRVWQERLKNWRDRYQSGQTCVWIPHFDEVGDCVGAAVTATLQSHGPAVVVVVVPADGVARSREWWHFRTRAQMKETWEQDDCLVMTLRSIFASSAKPSIGEWHPAMRTEMEVWVFGRGDRS